MLLKNKLKLIVILLILLTTSFFINNTKELSKSKNFDKKILASQIMNNSINIIKEYKIEHNIEINQEFDINKTGIIGDELTKITTTFGSLESKRTSSNPNFAALVVDLLNDLDLKAGDTVAANFSGSFPSVNIAVLSALEACDINAIIISSIGSSTYGANNPNLSYIDMENLLYEKGIISNKSSYYSMGGIDDLGLEFEKALKGSLIKRMSSYNIEYLNFEKFEENLDYRYNTYNSNGNISAFINVGGNLVSFGKSSTLAYLSGGIIYDLPKNTNGIGLGQMFIENNIPIIHFLNIKDLAKKYGLPIDPVPIPNIGEGVVYYVYTYNKLLIIIVLSISLYTLKGIKYEDYFKDKKYFIEKQES